jgi:hypothetical protein
MTIEQQLREQLERSTQDVPAGPDLAVSVSRGRARRRRRGMLLAGGGLVAGTAVAALLLVVAVGGTSDRTGTQIATDPTTSAPGAAGDGSFVTGTALDELLEAVVARHLPALGRPDDVYPSDWDHAGPMPDADHADATDWQAVYTAGPHDRLLVIMGWPKPGERAASGCAGGTPGAAQPACHRERLPGGGSVTDQSYRSDEGYTFYSSYVAGSGFTVNALETVTAGSWDRAVAGRVLASQDLGALVTDPRLTFPMPASRQ